MNLLLSDPAFLSVASGVSYDLDAAAYIARVEGASGDNQTLEAAVKDAINSFVVGCKADGIWNAIKASCILAGARTLNGALQPLAGTAPTNYNFVVGDYNRKTGLVGDGSTKYLDSNRNNNADPQNSQHMSVYITTTPSGGTTVPIGSNYALSGATNLSTVDFRCRSTTAVYVNTSVLGFNGVSRDNASDCVSRTLGATQVHVLASQAPASSAINVFRTGNAPVAAASNARLAFYSIGESLDLAKLDARVTTLINAFSAAIP